MQKVYLVIGNSGDGCNFIEWYEGSKFTEEDIREAAKNDKYDSYQSGDGIRIDTLEFPDSFDLSSIKGINWATYLPGLENY